MLFYYAYRMEIDTGGVDNAYTASGCYGSLPDQSCKFDEFVEHIQAKPPTFSAHKTPTVRQPDTGWMETEAERGDFSRVSVTTLHQTFTMRPPSSKTSVLTVALTVTLSYHGCTKRVQRLA